MSTKTFHQFRFQRFKVDGPVKSIFSRQDAKTAKKRFLNINKLPLRALPTARRATLPALWNLFCSCFTGRESRRGIDFLRMCQGSAENIQRLSEP